MAAVKKKPTRRSKKHKTIAGALTLARQVCELAPEDLWMNFDREADVLYLSFKRPQQSNETVELSDEGMVLFYRDAELVGITVLDASTR